MVWQSHVPSTWKAEAGGSQAAGILGCNSETLSQNSKTKGGGNDPPPQKNGKMWQPKERR